MIISQFFRQAKESWSARDRYEYPGLKEPTLEWLINKIELVKTDMKE